MDSDEVFNIIEIIAGENSRNTKIHLLEEFLPDEDFKRVIQYAYDPFKNFYMLKTPPAEPGDGIFTEETWFLLDHLSQRLLTGNLAKQAVKEHLETLGPESYELFKRILNKDLKAGVNVKSINKSFPGLIPRLAYMRCSLPKEVHLDSFNWESGVFSQEKSDGMFVNVNVYANHATFFTRKGWEFNPADFQECVKSVVKHFPCNTQLHGEAEVYHKGILLDRKTGNGILNSLLQGKKLPADCRIVIKAWDMVPLDDISKGICDTPYRERFANIETAINDSKNDAIQLIESRYVHSFEEAYAHFEELRRLGKEGTIFKDPSAKWEDKTSKQQVKLKAEYECELRVLGLNPGTGRNSDTFGSVACTTECGRLRVDVYGFTDKDRERIIKDDDWVGGIIAVKYNELITDKKTGTYSLFLPRYVEDRLDKDQADTLEYLQKL